MQRKTPLPNNIVRAWGTTIQLTANDLEQIEQQRQLRKRTKKLSTAKSNELPARDKSQGIRPDRNIKTQAKSETAPAKMIQSPEIVDFQARTDQWIRYLRAKRRLNKAYIKGVEKTITKVNEQINKMDLIIKSPTEKTENKDKAYQQLSGLMGKRDILRRLLFGQTVTNREYEQVRKEVEKPVF